MSHAPDSAANLLVWLDLETTGLDESECSILEIAMVVTTSELAVVADSGSVVVRQSEGVLANMDAWAREHHEALVAEVRESTTSLRGAERKLIAMLCQAGIRRNARLCGNTVSFDQRFLNAHMPDLASMFRFSVLDVTTLSVLGRLWYPAVCETAPRKQYVHRAHPDVMESIAELRHYRDAWLRARILPDLRRFENEASESEGEEPTEEREESKDEEMPTGW